MKSISVKFDSITLIESQNIVNHYNSIKPPHFSNLEILDRYEGGFQISRREDDIINNIINNKIKQLRWNKKKLDRMNYIGFNDDETLLLYKSFIHVFDESLVVYK